MNAVLKEFSVGSFRALPENAPPRSIVEWDPFVDSNIVIGYFTKGYDVHGTGIVRIFNGHGIVMATDGLRRDLDGNEISTDEQKIVISQSLGCSFAFAATGVTWAKEDEQEPFDVVRALSAIDATVAAKQYDSVARYIEAFARGLGNAFRNARRDGRVRKFADFGKGNLIARVLFAGYYRGHPFMSEIAVNRKEQEIEVPQPRVNLLSLREIKIEISGSEAVKQSLLSDADLTFPAHQLASWASVRQKHPFTIDQGVELARTYLESCASPEGRNLDEDCKSIGGIIRALKITKDGVEWSPEPPTTSEEGEL